MRRYAVTATALVVLAGAACSSHDAPPATGTSAASTTRTIAPSTTSTTTTSTTPAPSPTTTVAIPPEAQKHTEEGAEAFARFFWESASRTLVDNDSSTVMSLSAPTCKQCKVFTEIAEGEAAKGVHSDKFSYDIKIVRIVTGQANEFTVSVAGNELPVNKVDHAGKVLEKTKPGVFSWATKVAWQGRWAVTAFEAER